MPRALALFAGTIGFVAAILLGMAGGSPPASTLFRAVACGAALSVLALLAGALGVQVVKESQDRQAAASAAPPPAEGGGPPAAGGSMPLGSAKTAPPAATGETGAAGGARPRAAAKAGAAPAVR